MGEKAFTAKRWIVIQRNTVSEVAITTASGKRLKPSTRAEIIGTLGNPRQCEVYPISYSVRLTLYPTHTGAAP